MASMFNSVLSVAFIIVLVEAQEGFTLTEEQKTTINLNLCPVFDYMACLKNRIDEDQALKECTSNSDCDIDSGSFCCPSKCAGMRCSPRSSQSFVDEFCPRYNPADLFRSCKQLNYNCTMECRCCTDVASCSRKCLE